MILMVQTDQMGEVAYVFAACDRSVYGRAEKPRMAEITGRGAAQLRGVRPGNFDPEIRSGIYFCQGAEVIKQVGVAVARQGLGE